MGRMIALAQSPSSYPSVSLSLHPYLAHCPTMLLHMQQCINVTMYFRAKMKLIQLELAMIMSELARNAVTYRTE